MVDIKNVRVRFAPSPTGPLHMGGVRTALFNYLFAKKNGGEFILRIEDTDQTRYVPGAEEYIIESLEWCGLKIDEGPGIGGEFGPYRQSERKDIYKKYAFQLVESGDAYFAFDTAEDLDKVRAECEAKKETFVYSVNSRMSLNNSLTISKEETEKRIAEGVPYVIRFKMPEGELVTETDLIRGEVSFRSELLDDKVLYKGDGMPTYHLANVVDDYLMKISHVIRGEEWLPSMPLHILLYKRLGWIDSMPRFAHLPLILKPVGKGKLSKRDGDKLGFPVFPLEWKSESGVAAGYREDGYLPEAFVNMLALLGWNPGVEEELFSLDQLVELFSLERVTKSGARFSPDKSKWFNHQYISKMDNSSLAKIYMADLASRGVEADISYVEVVVGAVKERAELLSDLWTVSSFFFVRPEQYDAKVTKKRWKGAVPAAMLSIVSLLKDVQIWEADTIKAEVSSLVSSNEWNFGAIMNSFRLALVGGGFGPDLFLMCEMIGKDEVIARLEVAIDKLPKE